MELSAQLYMAELDGPEYTPLRKEEEALLFERFREGDMGARDRIVTGYQRLVIKMANWYKDSGVMLMDLVQEGNLGLLSAIPNFNPDSGNRFYSLAKHYIKDRMRTACCNSGAVRIPDRAAKRLATMEKRSTEFFVQEGRYPTEEELADMMSMGMDNLYRLKGMQHRYDSLDSNEALAGSMGQPEVIRDELAGREMEYAFESSLDRVCGNGKSRIEPQRLKRMMKMRISGMSTRAVAKAMGVSHNAVNKAERRVMRDIRKRMNALT